MLSSRSKRFLQPRLPYMEEIIKSFSNQYDPIQNPNGTIMLAIAENKLISELMLQKIESLDKSFPSYVLNYTSSVGSPNFKNSLAKFLESYVFKNCQVNPDNLILAAGCTALLGHLSLFLFESNDCVLIPTPYYPAFDRDFLNLADVNCYEIYGESATDANPFGIITQNSLQSAYENAVTVHKSIPKAIILTNPSNPLGIIYSKKEILDIIDFCNQKNIHLIVDEIYALSVFGSDGSFESVATILNNNLGPNIHVLWGFSKDFGASGFRVGVAYTQNKDLIQCMSSLNDFMQVSHITQEILASVINDTAFVENLLIENRNYLKRSYDYLKEKLESVGVIVYPANSGIFTFCDFRKFLRENSFESEFELFQKLCNQGIILTPGESCHSKYPGFFRVCYAFNSYETLKVAINRIVNILTN